MLSLDVTRKVRALLDRANHPGTPQAEAAANEAGFNVQTVQVVTENSRARGSTNADFEA